MFLPVLVPEGTEIITEIGAGNAILYPFRIGMVRIFFEEHLREPCNPFVYLVIAVGIVQEQENLEFELIAFGKGTGIVYVFFHLRKQRCRRIELGDFLLDIQHQAVIFGIARIFIHQVIVEVLVPLHFVLEQLRPHLLADKQDYYLDIDQRDHVLGFLGIQFRDTA